MSARLVRMMFPSCQCPGTDRGGTGYRASNRNFTPSKASSALGQSHVRQERWVRASGEVLPPGKPRWLSLGLGDSGGMRRVPSKLPGHQPCPRRQRLEGLRPPRASLPGKPPARAILPEEASPSASLSSFPGSFSQHLQFYQEFTGGSTAPPAVTRMAVPFGIHHLCWSRCISAGTRLVLGQAAPLAFGILYLWSY